MNDATSAVSFLWSADPMNPADQQLLRASERPSGPQQA